MRQVDVKQTAAAAPDRSLIIEKRQNGFHTLFEGKKILSDLITFSIRFDAFRKEETVVFRRNLL